jgi:hypothetical protein
VITNSKLVPRLEDMAAGKARGSKDAGDWEAAGVVAIGALRSEDFSAHLLHVDIVCIESLRHNAVVHITVGVNEKEDILTSCFPLLDLQ